MLFPLNVRRRSRQPEVMDQPDLDAVRHREALCGLARLNAVSGAAAPLWRAVAPLARQGCPLRLLDIACGGGDIALQLWRKARSAGVPLQIAGCDISPTAVAHARQAAATAGADVPFFTADVLTGPLPAGYDVLTACLFLHHLDEAAAAEFLHRAGTAARHLLLVSDLHRCTPGLLAAWAASRLLTRSPVVHADALLSVRAAFTLAETVTLAERAGLRGASVRRIWPFRFLLTWRKGS